ncbi:MAG: GNAT family N-acetyltransferase [Oscillospiraceae bacterium]|nr:GNAT family N-acetyltransferase [Oscillospiraceae bacterium]
MNLSNMNFDRFTYLLSYEYGCRQEDFINGENILTEARLADYRRHYSDEKPFFQMVTSGSNAVITADRGLHPFLREFMAERKGHTLFEQPELFRLERELNLFGQTLTASRHIFLSSKVIMPKDKLEVKWFFGKDIHQFYDGRFPNALCDRFHEDRPDTIAVCAYDGDKIMGMAGCSDDAHGIRQIGIDVFPEYRSKGVGTHLVTLLKNRIARDGDVAFYTTSLSNYHSWNIALNSGFRPAFVEINSVPIKERTLP